MSAVTYKFDLAKLRGRANSLRTWNRLFCVTYILAVEALKLPKFQQVNVTEHSPVTQHLMPHQQCK